MSGNNENIDQKLRDKFGAKNSFNVPAEYFESIPTNVQDKINAKQKKKGLLRLLAPVTSGITAILILAFYLLSSPGDNNVSNESIANVADDATLNLYAEYLLDYADESEIEEELNAEMLDWELENMEENDIIEYLYDDIDIDLNDIYDEI